MDFIYGIIGLIIWDMFFDIFVVIWEDYIYYECMFKNGKMRWKL